MTPAQTIAFQHPCTMADETANIRFVSAVDEVWLAILTINK